MCRASLSQNLSVHGEDHVFTLFPPSAEVKRFRLIGESQNTLNRGRLRWDPFLTQTHPPPHHRRRHPQIQRCKSAAPECNPLRRHRCRRQFLHSMKTDARMQCHLMNSHAHAPATIKASPPEQRKLHSLSRQGSRQRQDDDRHPRDPF